MKMASWSFNLKRAKCGERLRTEEPRSQGHPRNGPFSGLRRASLSESGERLAKVRRCRDVAGGESVVEALEFPHGHGAVSEIGASRWWFERCPAP